MNDNDLKRLVNLLSYLKKHDDVESELSKKKDPPPGHAAGRRKPVSVTDSTQRRLLEALGSTQREGLTDPAVLQARKDARTSVGSGTPGSDPEETSEIPEISEGTEDSEGIIDPYKKYGPYGDEVGPRGGQFSRLGDTPVEGQIAPEMGSETSDGDDDWMNDINTKDWMKENDIHSLPDLQRMIANFVPKVKGPGDYERPAEQFKKSSESILLSLLGRLGI